MVIEEHLINEEEWKWVPARGDNNKNFSPSLSQVPLQNRYEVLDLDGQLDDLEENCLPRIETNEDGVERLWVRIKGKANKADVLLGVCYRPPNQEEEVDNLFYKQLKNVSGSSARVLVGDFKLPDTCWELHTAERRQSRKFLECMEDNFLSQLMGEPTRGGTMLDLFFVNADGLVGDVMVGGPLGQNEHEIIEFLIFGEVRRSTSKTLALDFRRADLGLFRRLIQSIPWEAALKNKGVQESWACLKTKILSAVLA
ncbi:hypothetical protein DUI87_31207 [Hirundo rustica rustica]|uniref:Endonuclease/exonuclease/phosphatase domain-containing protein n=1 Tax=Hirundo rustica rustica TaxID=333673 RepID=A0A3M0J003_HIRRU|nr:hypothetical protein DUI87_31207 [Hirundo rustica rustica]